MKKKRTKRDLISEIHEAEQIAEGKLRRNCMHYLPPIVLLAICMFGAIPLSAITKQPAIYWVAWISFPIFIFLMWMMHRGVEKAYDDGYAEMEIRRGIKRDGPHG